MSDINTVCLTGRLTRDAEEHQGNNKPYARMRLAFSQKRDESGYIDVAYFGPMGVLPYLVKGAHVGIEGSLNWREYDNDGRKQQNYSVAAFKVHLLGGKSEDKRMQETIDDLGGTEIPF